MDQYIADKIGKDTAHRSIELTTEGLFTNQIGCSYISYDYEGNPIPRNSDPPDSLRSAIPQSHESSWQAAGDEQPAG